MSRFVSADDADYASLEDQLLKPSSVNDQPHSPQQRAEGEAGAGAGASMPPPAAPAGASARAKMLPPAVSEFPHIFPGLGTPTLQPSGRGRASETPVRKLGTWDGVFMPVTLNVLSIILFLRFGFILGQVGLFGALLLLVLSYAIDTLTVLSLNAISTNGQVRGGGAYYLISRSLGPEFGGSIGIVFVFGQAFNASMNVLGFVESLVAAIGEHRGQYGVLPEGTWFLYLYGSLVLWLSTLVCLFGSSLFKHATLVLAAVLSLAVLSLPASAMVMPPFEDVARDVYYTSWSWATLTENLWPHFTTGAAGSSTAPAPETWSSVFGVLFQAVCGILAGASMSGDLRKPSKSIPKGTDWSLMFTFGMYVLSFVVMAATIPRESFYRDAGILGDVSRWPAIVVLGELATSAFSTLMGVMSCAKVLQAIARDDLLPPLAPFAQGTASGDVPIYAVLATALVCQLVLSLDSINLIAQLVTMTTLLTFGVLGAATFALKAGGAPSFRPSFRYWNIWTAGAGCVASFGAMLLTNAPIACVCIAFAVFLFVMIQVFSPPKPWGDVSHNVTYHFVRKYLLRLDERKGHVKYWRPQILLLANDPRTEWNLIIFCNSLKKGALYVLGHVLKGDFYACLPELRQSHLGWLKLVDVSGIKSFVDVIIARDEREGARNLLLTCGLGGMRPNIIVLGFPASLQRPSSVMRGPVSHSARGVDQVPDGPRHDPITVETYVGILEDALALNKAIALAYGFDAMALPGPSKTARYERPSSPQYIDLWPIQIANNAADGDEAPTWDTYTMVLQLGTILSFTGTWRRHRLRVSVFVEHADEVETERTRVQKLLENLRIPATLRVFCLSSGGVPRYDAIVLGKRALDSESSRLLRADPWWVQVCDLRHASNAASKVMVSAEAPASSNAATRRSPRVFGMRMPDEHLAYHHNNIRLGLAHPRSHEAEDSELDGPGSDVDEDVAYDDLENELAHLAVDWDPKYLVRARRAKTADALLDGGSGMGGRGGYGALSSSQRTVTPATAHAQDEGPDATPRMRPRKSAEAPARRPLGPSGEPRGGRAEAATADFSLSFNDLPNRAQYLILNELIRKNSTRASSVVFTALPAPAPGTSESREASLMYLDQLQMLYGGCPPILGVHATTLTMTMTL